MLYDVVMIKIIILRGQFKRLRILIIIGVMLVYEHSIKSMIDWK